MTKIVVDDHLRSRLLNLREPLQLCDESGKVIGEYFPIDALTESGNLAINISQEEIQRRLTSDERRYSTAEVIRHLESL